MRRAIGRFRTLLPPTTFVVLYAIVFLLASLPAAVAARQMGAAAVDATFRRAPQAVHLVGMFIYGIYRATAFHPYFRTGYRRWLELTPWAWGKPLPVGPAHPVAEDALIVAAAGLPVWLMGDFHPIASYAVALGGYLLALSGTFTKTGAWGYPFPVLFGLGLALRLCRGRPEYYGVAVLASYLVAMVGLRRSLRRWPWPEVPSLVYDGSRGFVVEGKPEPLGWPFDRLGPRHDPAPGRLSGPDKVLGALLAGWWCYALEHAIGPDGPLFLRITVLINMAYIGSAAHLIARVAGHAPPISLLGRIGWLRPLIPSYDQVLVTPIAGAFVASAGPSLLELGGVPFDVAVAASAGLAWMTLALGGPDRRAWQLTARCRILPGIAGSGKAGEFVQTG